MLERLAYSLGRNDEVPNIELAEELVKKKDLQGIREIVDGLSNNSEKIANDCIKVLYEIGSRDATLISDYVYDFVKLLKSKNNRLVWGSMTALSKVTSFKPKEVFANLDTIKKAYEKGSVITIDNSISVFAALSKSDPEYEKVVFPIIISHLEKCRSKEVGQHAERAFPCVNKENSDLFKKVLLKRRGSLTESQKKRVDKLIKIIEKGQYPS
ncbi:MAG: hypothetical protein H5T43_05490 [Methanomethylovorans sp.]|jgi:hypothetical protein|nr:hypothetical protein [Methanomethylovorans sp.]